MTGVAGHFENCCLLLQEVGFLERTCEVELRAKLLCLDCLLFCFSILLTVSHRNHLFQATLKVGHLKVFIQFRCVRVFDIGVATGISDADCEWEVLSIEILLDSF